MFGILKYLDYKNAKKQLTQFKAARKNLNEINNSEEHKIVQTGLEAHPASWVPVVLFQGACRC
jgi:hypothetical protein